MSASEIEALLGSPDEKVAREFGALVGDPWRGVAWKYYTRRDMRFQEIERRLCNTLVFAIKADSLYLNNWIIEDAGVPQAQE